MPQMANITVKKNDGTTDQLYLAQVPSSGEGSPAIWRAHDVGTAPAHRPEFRLSSRDASSGTKRALRATYVYPQIATNTTTSVTSVVDRGSVAADWLVPKSMNQTEIDEMVSQFANLVRSELIKDCAKFGYAAS